MPINFNFPAFVEWFVQQGLQILFPPDAPLAPGHIFAALSAAVGA